MGKREIRCNPDDSGLGEAMGKFIYNGVDERVFPAISVIVQPGDEFDAPDDFVAADVTPKTTKPTKQAGDE